MDEIKSISELNKIGEAKLAAQQQQQSPKTVVSVEDLVNEGIVKEAEQEVSAAKKEIDSVFDGSKIAEAAVKRAERWQEELDKKVEEEEMNMEEEDISEEVSTSDTVFNDDDSDEAEVEDFEDDDELENEVLGTNNTDKKSSTETVKVPTKDIQITEDEMDKDLADLDKESLNIGDDDDDNTKKLKECIKSKFVTPLDTMDLSKFTVINKPINVNNISLKPVPTAHNWVLMRTGIPISMIPFDGEEIETLASIFDANSRRNIGTSDIERGYQLIYDHIVSSKGSSLRNFLKTISWYDLDHIFFAVYNSNYSDSNYIPYSCTDTKCKNAFMTDNVPIVNMCKFKDDAAKEKFNRIGRMDTTIDYKETYLYKSELIPISKDVAVTLREPSIYSMIFESLLINNNDFKKKYAFVLNYLPYIDGFYKIDIENQSIQPIGFKEYPNDVEKTLKSKVIVYTKILKGNLSSDEFSRFEIILNKFFSEFGEELSYVLPETICPECETKVEEQPTTASELVFTRHRLPAFAATLND